MLCMIQSVFNTSLMSSFGTDLKDNKVNEPM